MRAIALDWPPVEPPVMQAERNAAQEVYELTTTEPAPADQAHIWYAPYGQWGVHTVTTDGTLQLPDQLPVQVKAGDRVRLASEGGGYKVEVNNT